MLKLRRASLPTPEGFEQASKAQSKAVTSDLIFKSSAQCFCLTANVRCRAGNLIVSARSLE
jgi:hypothetical protein